MSMISSMMTWPLRYLPRPVTAVGLGLVLNLFFMRYPDLKERMRELAGKTFLFHVEDLTELFFMEVEEDGGVKVRTYTDNDPHVTMTGSVEAFLSLLMASEDPDSLFFSRKLKLSGETDTGLRFKNILDNVEIDWEKELSDLVGPWAGRRFAQVLQGMGEVGRRSRQAADERMEAWISETGAPRKEEAGFLSQESQELDERVEGLARRISRLEKKLRVAGR